MSERAVEGRATESIADCVRACGLALAKFRGAAAGVVGAERGFVPHPALFMALLDAGDDGGSTLGAQYGSSAGLPRGSRAGAPDPHYPEAHSVSARLCSW